MTSKLSRTLARAAYRNIEFPVVSSKTSYGHDSVEHTAYLVPGADQEPTGLRAARGQLTVALSGNIKGYGELYPSLYKRLCSEFEQNPRGLLRHPTRGLLEVLVSQWDEDVTTQVTDGLGFSFSWVEQGSRIAEPFDGNVESARSSPAALGEQLNNGAAEADAAVNRTVPDATKRPTAVAPTIESRTSFLESATRTYSETLGAVRDIDTVIAAALESTSIAGADGWEPRFLLSELRSLAQRYGDAFLSARAPRTFVVEHEMSLAELAALPAVLGDAKRARDLLANNRISNVFAVPVGTILTVAD